MPHGCGFRQRVACAIFATLICILTGSVSFAKSFAKYTPPSIGDRLVPVHMKSGKVKLITIRDAFLSQGVPEIALDEALDYFDQNVSLITNPNYLTIIDFSQHSSQERMYLGNLNSGVVEKLLVAHGKGSDPDHDGMANTFSNSPGSQASSLGFYLVAETYNGKHGYSARMDGLSESNSNARARAIVIHGADYVKQGLSKMGRSFGCPAVESNRAADIIDRLKDGSLLYITVAQ